MLFVTRTCGRVRWRHRRPLQENKLSAKHSRHAMPCSPGRAPHPRRQQKEGEAGSTGPVDALPPPHSRAHHFSSRYSSSFRRSFPVLFFFSPSLSRQSPSPFSTLVPLSACRRPPPTSERHLPARTTRRNDERAHIAHLFFSLPADPPISPPITTSSSARWSVESTVPSFTTAATRWVHAERGGVP